MEHAHDINGQVESPIIEDSKKDIGGLFSSLNPWVLFAGIVVCYMVVMLLGGYLGRVRMMAGIKEPETSMETAVAAVLGLLAFILGFTFSITWNKFANRNGLVIEHAKAISICYLRASLIPEKQKLEIRKILHEYMQVLLHIEDKNIERSLLLIDHLHIALWRETVSLAKEDMDGELRSIFIGSVNDLMSLSMERKTIALFIRVPNAIWRSVFFLAGIGMLAFGYQAGISGINKLFQLTLLPVAFGLVIVLIAELNSQDSQRHFKVTKRPLREVLEMMEKPIV